MFQSSVLTVHRGQTVKKFLKLLKTIVVLAQLPSSNEFFFLAEAFPIFCQSPKTFTLV